MDDRAPAHLLLYSGVAPPYSCGAPVWWDVDSCRAARGNEPKFAPVSPLHSLPMSTMFHCKLINLLFLS
jgi:hypothetical protein